MYSDATDLALLRAWQQQRDAEAFHTLVQRHAGLVYNTCRHILRNDTDAADVSQECFLKLAAAPPDIRQSLTGWLHRIATHRALDHLKAAKRRREREIRYATEPVDQTERPDAALLALIDVAIDTLPDKQRLPLIEHFLRQKTHQEVADTLGIPKRTATYRIDSGVKKLREALRSKGVAVPLAGLAIAVRSNAAEAPGALYTALGKHAMAGASPGFFPATGGLVAALALKKAWIAAAAAAAGLLLAWWFLAGQNLGAPREPGSGFAPLAVREHDPGAEAEASVGTTGGDEDLLSEESAEAIPESAAATAGVGIISGRVYDADTEGPVPGASVIIAPQPGTKGRATICIVDEDGAYASKSLAAGDYMVSCGGAPGYPATSEKNFSHHYKLERRIDGVVLHLAADASIDFPLRRGLYVEGAVIDKRGRGIPGATVTAVGANEYNGQVAQTDSDGRFRLAGFSATTSLALSAHKPGHGRKNYTAMTLLPPGMDDLQIELPNAASIAGAVHRADGAPAANARVLPIHVPHMGSWPMEYPEARTDAEGRFKLDDLGPGRYTIEVYPEHYFSFFAHEPFQIELREGEHKTGVEITMEDGAGFDVTGAVSDAEGLPLAGAVVNMYGSRNRTAVTNDRGEYRVGGLAEGRYDLEVFKRGYRNARKGQDLNLLADVEDLDFVLKKNAAAIVGKVTDADTGDPIQAFEIAVEPGGHDGPVNRRVWYGAERVYSADGSFRIEGVDSSAGTCTVFARAEGFGESFVTASLSGEESETEVNVAVPEGLTYVGSVVDHRGAPVAGAIVVAGEFNPQSAYGRTEVAVAGDDGQFEATGVSPLFEAFAAVHPEYPPAKLTVQEGGDRTLRFKFEAAGSIRIVVTEDGRPAPGYGISVLSEAVPPSTATEVTNESGETVTIHTSTNERHYGRTDEAGEATIRRLPAGRYGIEIAIHDGAEQRAVISLSADVSADYTTDVHLPISAGTALGGTLFAGGAPAKFGEVVYEVVTEAYMARYTPQFMSDGTWWIDKATLGAGTLHLVAVRASDEQTYRRAIELNLAPGEQRVLNIDLAEKTAGAE